MKRYLGFLVLGLLIAFGVSSNASADVLDALRFFDPTPPFHDPRIRAIFPAESAESAEAHVDLAVPKSTSVAAKASEWNTYKIYRGDDTAFNLHKLHITVNNVEKVFCEVEEPVDKPKTGKVVYLYSSHGRQLATGAWAYANEDMMIENGKITGRRVSRDKNFTPNVDAYSFEGKYSPFFTYCDPLKDGLPKEVSALIVKPAP